MTTIPSKTKIIALVLILLSLSGGTVYYFVQKATKKKAAAQKKLEEEEQPEEPATMNSKVVDIDQAKADKSTAKKQMTAVNTDKPKT